MEAHMSEIVTLKEDFSKYATELAAKLHTLKTKTQAINKLASFKGATADSAKAYFTTVHGELINELEEAIKQLDQNLTKITNEFNSVVDRSQNAIVKENYLQEITTQVNVVDQEVLDIHTSEKMTNQKVSDIVSLSSYNIHGFSASIHESKRFLQKVTEDLYQYDQQALRTVKSGEENLTSLADKTNKRAADRAGALTGNLNALHVNDTDEKSLSDLVNGGLSSFRHILTGLNATDKRLTILYQTAVLFRMNKSQRMQFFRTGMHSMNLADYRRFNNMLRSSPFKMSTKEFLWQYRDSKMRGFPKGKLDSFKKLAIPFGRNRGKLAMMKEFNKLYGLEKYQQFKSLKTTAAKTTRIGKTFYDEVLGNKINSTKNIIKNSSWNKPKTIFKSAVDELKTKPANANIFGKIVGRSLGPLSAGLHVRENFVQNKGDTQKIVVGSAVDIGAGSIATATGAAIGSAFLPPIGTVVGGAVGAAISTGFHAKLPWGEPPKSLSDHTKDLANKAVDGVKNAAKGIGKKISGWFK